MNTVQAVLFVAAVILAALRAFQVGGRVDLGWLAIACVIAAVGTIPAVHLI